MSHTTIDEVKKDVRFINLKNGKSYWVYAVATHTETCGELVVYMDMGGNVWARPLNLFLTKFKKA